MLPKVIITGTGLGGDGGRLLAESLAGATAVVVRTLRHPELEEALARAIEPHVPVISCDDLYDASDSFAETYARIAQRVIDLAGASGGPVAYLVPGSPLIAEAVVGLLRERDGIDLEIRLTPGVIDLALDRLGIDPIDGFSVADAAALAGQLDRYHGNVLALQAYDPIIARELALAGSEAGAQVVLLHHLGLADEIVAEIESYRDPRLADADHLTSLALIGLGYRHEQLAHAVEMVADLRVRCPWDAEQTHESLAKHLIEEAYEVVEAIEAAEASPEGSSHLEEELGDLLLQVLFHANIASEEGEFDLESIAAKLTEKLVARHPHVFGDQSAHNAEEVLARWERSKQEQKGRESIVDGIPPSLPAALRLQKLAKKAAALTGDYDLAAELAATAARDSTETALIGAAVDYISSGGDLEQLLRTTARDLEGRIRAREASPE